MHNLAIRIRFLALLCIAVGSSIELVALGADVEPLRMLIFGVGCLASVRLVSVFPKG